VDGRPRAMHGRPKWTKVIINHKDEGDEFGDEGFKDGMY
jgi:hypothetical protein